MKSSRARVGASPLASRPRSSGCPSRRCDLAIVSEETTVAFSYDGGG
jgi:hypothetical protein